MQDFLAHRLEDRLMRVERGLGPRNPERELAGCRDLLDAARAGIDNGPAFAGEVAGDADDGFLVDAREVDPLLSAGGRIGEHALAVAVGTALLVVRLLRL